MKFVAVTLFALLGLGAAANADTKSPVEQIVKLLENMKETITNDGKHEQQIYDKYACWCETTAHRKADDINQARSDLRALGQRILKLKGTVATRSAEIADLTEKIEANEGEQEEMTAVRQKQNAAWAAETAETKQALAALQQAIKTLSDATAPKKESALIQSSLATQSRMAVANVLERMPSRVSSGLTTSSVVLLSEFSHSTTGFAPQSATIQGMLGDMYLTFAANVESATEEEADQNYKFENLYAELEHENNQFKDTRERKQKEKAEAEAFLADTTKAYDDTETQMHADEDFFDQTKEACESKHAEWTTRVDMRDQELDGISKALDILTGDGARELFATSIKPGVESFLQVDSDSNEATGVTLAAYKTLKAQATKTHNYRLAALAVQVRTAKAGHFDDVIGAIDKMIQTLKDEGAADIDKKNQCNDEYQDIAKTVNDLDWKIKNNEAQIAKLQGLIELRTKEKEDTVEKIGETKEFIKQIEAERKEEHEAFMQAKKDDEAAIKILNSAKDAMTKFYKKNEIKMGKIQGSVKLLQKDPEFAVGEDQAPDATFSNKGGHKLESKNIISLFDYIIEDLNDEVANERKAEATSQADFEKEKNSAEEDLNDLKEKKVTLEGIIAKRGEQKGEENVDMKENNKDRDAELAYQDKITPDCDWIKKAFTGRADARAAEMDGLTTAKEFLAGKTALVQTQKKFNDEKFQSIGFLSMH